MEHLFTFWNDRPCNIQHSIKKIGTKEYFDEVETLRNIKRNPIFKDLPTLMLGKAREFLKLGVVLVPMQLIFVVLGLIILVLILQIIQ